MEHAVEAWRLTGGGFDPMQLHAVTAAGYDRSFEELTADGDVRPDSSPPPVTSGRFDLSLPGCTDIEFGDGTITIPAGVGFDPGGIGKGLAADLVAFELMEAGAAGVCVNMGGDVRVIGRSPTGSGWTVAIEHPQQSSPIALVGLAEGAVATSSVLRRLWTVGGERRHHLIDPATGQPSTSDVALATVVASHAWLAEVLAKAVLLRGTERAFDLLDDSAAALIVGHDTTIHTTVGFLNFVGDADVAARLQLNLAGQAEHHAGDLHDDLNINPGPGPDKGRALT